MARGVNLAVILGNLGSDPVLKELSNGKVVNVSIATTSSWKDKQSGQQQERTEWHRVVFYNRLAEIAAQYLRKGSQVYIQGRLRTRDYEKEGQKHYITEIVASEMQMVGGRGGTAAIRPARLRRRGT